MNVGLIDVDGHNFPNLPLMKISAFHKAQGDDVEFVFPFYHYDKIYMSKVFTFTPDYQTALQCDDIVYGGTGYDLRNILPEEIEHMCPDYDLYKNFKFAVGFLTRGCPRSCDFCIVSEKEGNRSITVSELNEFYSGQKEIKLLDPNITANKDCLRHFNELIKTNAWIDFTQGLDIRCMTGEKANMLNLMKIKMIHFAWDNYEFDTYEKLKAFRPILKYDTRKLRVYVLTNFNTTHEQDLERIYKLKEIGYHPYIMIYNKSTAPKYTRWLQRWTNNPRIWWSGSANSFEDYKLNFMGR